VQTFLPYPDFGETARVLDPKRLGNQRSEALVILRVCRIPTYGWQHHPAVRMWRGHEDALICYRVAICDRGTASGYADTVKEKLLEYSVDRSVSAQHELAASGRLPPWLGTLASTSPTSRPCCVRTPDWYRRSFPDVPDNLPCFWPV